MKQKLTPSEIARQTLMQLSKEQLPPTPENFRLVYDKIAGVQSHDRSTILVKSLEKVLLAIGKEKPQYALASKKISSSLKKQDITGIEDQLRQLFSMEKDSDTINWGNLLRYMLKQLEAHHVGLPLSQKREDLNRIIQHEAHDLDQLAKKMQILITSWGEGKAVFSSAMGQESAYEEETQENVTSVSLGNQKAPPAAENLSDLALQWRNMLINTIKLAVMPKFAENPAAASRIAALLKETESSNNINHVDEFNGALKSTLLRAELLTEKQDHIQASLVRMLNLLLSTLNEQADEYQWLHGQINIVKEVIATPLDVEKITDAEHSIEELIFQQSSFKPGLVDAKDTIKSMMNSFVSGLAEITDSTENYQTKMSAYQQQISSSNDLTQLNSLLQNLVNDISEMSANAQKSHASFKQTQIKIEVAEKEIHELTTKLDYISQVAQQDFLTGALNRRGMEAAVEREFDRADRHNTPLSLAILDIDHFKKINDTMGHSTGDEALTHLAKVVKSIIRSTDVLARYGGEEFVILLPGSKQEDAMNVITNVQRNLTKNFFMHDSNQVIITFSAGVAERKSGEHIDEVLPRADAALYIAKQSGRNRVIGAGTETSA